MQTLELWVLRHLLGKVRALALPLLEIDEAGRPIELVQRVSEQRPPIEPLLLLARHCPGWPGGGGRDVLGGGQPGEVLEGRELRLHGQKAAEPASLEAALEHPRQWLGTQWSSLSPLAGSAEPPSAARRALRRQTSRA